MAGAIWDGLVRSSEGDLKNGFVVAEARQESNWSRILTTPARFLDRGEVRSAVLRRSREVFEDEEPFEVMTHRQVAVACRFDGPGARSLQNPRAYWQAARLFS